jgi:hypothetical protein
MKRWIVTLALSLATCVVMAAPATATAKSVDLKVLIVSTGTAAEDPGLNLMDDMLDQAGVPYDVLDARREQLTPDRLASSDHGFYNGVIVTNTELYYWNPDLQAGQSAFTAEEWQALHDYERNFRVRESVISGFPTTNASLGLDYGMSDISAGSNFSAIWVPPAGGHDLFEYVNTNHPLQITDFAFHGQPTSLYTGEPRNDGTGPDAQPLLVLDQDHSKALVSVLRYSDGREVLLSTISNAWFLIHSQVLAYEFLNFATKGVFIGGREVSLSAHNDDLFLPDTLWDPVRNLTDGNSEWRMSGAEYNNAIVAQGALRAAHPTAADFKLDFAFNGHDADRRVISQPPASLPSVADTFLRQREPNKNFGTDNVAEVQFKSGAQDAERALLRFDVPVDPVIPVASATLRLFSEGTGATGLPARACAVTAAWDEGTHQDNKDATWRQRKTNTLWTAQGADYNAATCIPFTMLDKQTVSVDVSPIAAAWRRGALPNYGLIVVAAADGAGKIRTREEGTAAKRPALDVTFGTGLAARLTKPLRVPDLVVQSARDTFLRQREPNKNFGTDNVAEVQLKGTQDEERALAYFDVRGTALPPVAQATLALYTEGADSITAKVCPVTVPWDEGTHQDNKDATWRQRKTLILWSSAGGDYDASACQPFTFRNGGIVSIDVTQIVEDWSNGDIPNNGLVVVPTKAGQGKIRTREEGTAAKRPVLTVSFETVTPDSLTAAVSANPDAFRYINHTFTHRDMDVSAGTTYEQAKFEILENQATWDLLGLPGRAQNNAVMISGDHSGLRDDMGTDNDPTDDQPYPAARNDQFLSAAEDAGIRYLASDSSQANQDVEGYVPGHNLLLLPRYPTAVFYNVTTPAEMTDEYNYIFRERYLNAGQDPCTIPGAVCSARNYQQILDAEADTAVRHMLSYKPWPHFFHQSNVRNYDGAGNTLQFDWLNAVLNRYEQLFKLPIRNPAYYEIAKQTEDRLVAKRAGITGTLDLDTGKATISAASSARTFVTGLAGGTLYGGQSLQKVSVGSTATEYTVDRALDR